MPDVVREFMPDFTFLLGLLVFELLDISCEFTYLGLGFKHSVKQTGSPQDESHIKNSSILI